MKALEACLKVEKAAAQLYHLYAKLHRADAGMSALWSKTAREEENHARQVEMVMLRRGRMSVLVKADPQKAERALTLVETAIADSTRSTRSVRRALEDAIALENLLIEFHADYAVKIVEAVDQQLFRSMMAADKDHVGALQAALDGLTGR